jgi:hypothetical protein
MECDPTPGRLQPTDREDSDCRHRLAIDLDRFAWETISEQSTELGVSVEELVSFSVLYYIADLDSKRIARRLPPSPSPSPQRPLADSDID